MPHAMQRGHAVPSTIYHTYIHSRVRIIVVVKSAVNTYIHTYILPPRLSPSPRAPFFFFSSVDSMEIICSCVMMYVCRCLLFFFMM
ncbi:hypothetical protein F4809DRAFT_596415 [Biscogniauxia mediterranea]|nr:hypothetical protein F4809DRAFT_596415 [Biscogniauxia mediterranea]